MQQKILKLNKAHVNGYIIYTRKSTDDTENQKNSIDFQISESRQFAAKEHYPIVDLSVPGFCNSGIIEEHHSGYEEDNEFSVNANHTVTIKVVRPKFLKLVSLAQQKEIKGIICLCWDRLSRNESDDAIIKKLIRLGCEVIFVTTKYNNTSSGALHMDIDGMFSRHYSRVISEKVKDSYKKLIAEGKCIYSVPLGYINNGSDNKPLDPNSSPIVKRLFELYAAGNWSYESLAKWANEQGLTSRATRKRRTPQEKAAGVDLESRPLITFPITRKTIENILKSPFYIGQLTYRGKLITSSVHEPLIEPSLFYRVQTMIKNQTTSVRYQEPLFFIYRGLLKCGICGRIYTAYMQKGNVYYRPNCKAGCTNTTKNVKEGTITTAILALLDKIHLRPEETLQLERLALTELDKVTEKRNKEIDDLYRQRAKLLADYDYLLRDKLNLLRTGVYTPEKMIEEEARLSSLLEGIKSQIEANVESTQAMLDYVILFSDLVKNQSACFDVASASEKRELIKQAFSELFFVDGVLKYQANEGFSDLLRRYDMTDGTKGAPFFLIYELPAIYPAIREAIRNIRGGTLEIIPKRGPEVNFPAAAAA